MKEGFGLVPESEKYKGRKGSARTFLGRLGRFLSFPGEWRNDPVHHPSPADPRLPKASVSKKTEG